MMSFCIKPLSERTKHVSEGIHFGCVKKCAAPMQSLKVYADNGSTTSSFDLLLQPKKQRQHISSCICSDSCCQDFSSSMSSYVFLSTMMAAGSAEHLYVLTKFCRGIRFVHFSEALWMIQYIRITSTDLFQSALICFQMITILCCSFCKIFLLIFTIR